jgi:hypothetical protein
VVRVILMRKSIESVPKDGQFVIVEDESGNDDVARWSSELETWVGLNGDPTAILPTHWWPMPTGRTPPPSVAPAPPPGLAVPQLNTFSRSSAPSSSAYAAPVSAGLGDGQSNVVPLRNRTKQVSRRRRSFPLFSVSLFSIVALGAVMGSVVRDDSMRSFRDVFAWLPGFDSMSAAAQPPAVRRASDVTGSLQVQPPLQVAVEKSVAEKSAAEPRTNQGLARDKPSQSAILEAARLNQALEQKRESGEAAGLNVKVTSDVVPLARPVQESSETRLARAIDDSRAGRDWAALREPAEQAEKSGEAEKLIERAAGSLKQGDISAARWLLSFAYELGSARAGFMLAETYDPRILVAWKVMGTRADPAKARDLYAKAYSSGIGEAKGRLQALAE